MTSNKYQIDMCHGPLFSKIMAFALPLMFTCILQMLFNAVDLIVIGHYAPPEAMAAIGASMGLNALVINVFIGISIGANVLAARFFGARDFDNMSRTVHTSIVFAVYGGIALMIVGIAVARPVLELMDTPEDILPRASTYIWICLGSIPFIMLYNFGCAILRAVGDTRRPLYFLIIAGILNVLLNLFFVIVCGMEVGGVALATVISHGISALLILKIIIFTREVYRLYPKKLSIDFTILSEMLKIGIPAGVQNSCIVISTMIIQSSINSFGSLAIAGNTAVAGLEGIAYVGSFAFHQTAISFVAQNLGGRKFKRILRSLYSTFFCGAGYSLLLGLFFYFAGEFLLAIFNPDPSVIAWGMVRIKILFTTYILCGIMDVTCGGLRGLGYSLLSSIISVFGICVFRVWWVWAVFPHYRTMENLMFSYPISWLLVSLINGGLLFWICRKMIRTNCTRSVTWSKPESGISRGFRFLDGIK